MRKCQTWFYSGPASRRSSPSNRPLEEQSDGRPGSVPCSTGPSNIYSSHKLLPTASLTAVGAAEGRAEQAHSCDSHRTDNAVDLNMFRCANTSKCASLRLCIRECSSLGLFFFTP